MQFNQYSLYSINTSVNLKSDLDFVDKCREDLIGMNEYSEVKDYLISKFGNVSGEKWVEYSELKKEVYMLIDEDKVEFCALKNDQQYFGKGWKQIKTDK